MSDCRAVEQALTHCEVEDENENDKAGPSAGACGRSVGGITRADRCHDAAPKPLFTIHEVLTLLLAVKAVSDTSPELSSFREQDPAASVHGQKFWLAVHDRFRLTVRQTRDPTRSAHELFKQYMAHLDAPGVAMREKLAVDYSADESKSEMRRSGVRSLGRLVEKVKQRGGKIERDDASFEGDISRVNDWVEVKKAVASKASIGAVVSAWVVYRFDAGPGAPPSSLETATATEAHSCSQRLARTL